MSISSHNGSNSNEDTTMNSEVAVLPPTEQVTLDQSNSMEDIEMFIKDNINIQTDYLKDEIGDAADPDLERLPTEEEWNGMKRYGSFITHDDAGKEYTFHVNDIIYVLPTNKNPENPIADNELWIAQIKSIRARNSRDRGVQKRFSTDILSPKWSGLVQIKQISFLRLPVAGTDFVILIDSPSLRFYYSMIMTGQKERTGNSRNHHHRALSARERITQTPTFSTTALVHHVVKAGMIIRMESLDGEFNIDLQLDQRSPRKKARRHQESQNTDLYEKIPKDLLEIARQPIIRGRSMGVVGNVCSVTRARKLISAVMRDGEEIPENWKSSLGLIYGANDVRAANIVNAKKALGYACPKCGEPI
ncbi:hypothetical protein Clacol_002879 [Clathrus columnatus]|uniref:Uncharacterized protein n=1 Tax=Clathrus columnatus TaxID=1419009 RepID=A0AAV5A6S2_9AGAM|nr:hypothetical protein Clacol_002879 [Clathrus columnatus]